MDAARTRTATVIGIEGHLVEVEANIAQGQPATILTGLPDTALREARDRVRAALLAHPLVGQLDLADGLADRLLAENRDFLPWARGA